MDRSRGGAVRPLVLLALTLAAMPASGWDLDAIAVTGTRTSQRLSESPVVTEILTEKEIQESGASNLTEILASYGLILDDNASHGDATLLQGLGTSRVLVLLDGRRVVGRVAQNLDGGGLPLTNVERIEIVRGPQSALYGSDAMGGVINILTKKPALKPSWSAQVENSSIPAYDDPQTKRGASPTGAAVFQTQKASASLNLPLGELLSSWSASGSRSVAYFNELGEVSLLPRSLVGRFSFEGASDSEAGRLTFGLSGTSQNEEDQTDFTKSLHRKEVYRAEAYGSWKGRLPGDATLETKLYNHWYQRSVSDYSGGLAQWTPAEPERENLTGAEAWYSVDLSDDNTLTVGLEATWDLLHDDDLSVGGEWGVNDRQALVLQDQQSGEELYSVVSGVRFERGRFGLFAAPKVSAMYNLAPGIRLLGGAGVGYRAPSTEDLYYDIDWVGHPVVLGNLDLRPEYSLAGNLGVEVVAQGFSSRLNAYHQELFDEIVFVETGSVPDGRVVYQNRNKARTSRSGVDAEASATFFGFAKADAAYGCLLGWDRDEQTLIAGLAAHQARGGLSLSWPWGLSARVHTQWDSLRNHVVVGAGLTQAWASFEFFARAENLTNVIDAAHGPFAPVTITLGARYQS